MVVLPYILLLLLVEEQYLNNRNINKKKIIICKYIYFFPGVCTVWLYSR